MKVTELGEIIKEIAEIISKNKEYLISLDQQNGDGDLGISMEGGFSAVASYLGNCEETDLGRVLNKCGSCFNEAAPSSLGTIISFGFKGMAKALKGKEMCSFGEAADAMAKGLENIMEKAGSKPGEKTVLDALHPGVAALEQYAQESPLFASEKALEAAKAGSESTRDMRAVWGRAAYYGEKSIGMLDGGSVAGMLIFQGIYNYEKRRRDESYV